MEKTLKEQTEEMELERVKVALQRERLELEETRERNDQRIARKAETSRINQQRQDQLATDVRTRRIISSMCSHRQGGSPRNPYKGKGPTALNIVIEPDGFSRLIMCSICRLRVHSPHPYDQSAKPRDGESAVDVKRRVARYAKDKEEFDRLLEKAQDGLTAEATTPMDCGVKFRVTDSDGNQVLKRRPFESYATA